MKEIAIQYGNSVFVLPGKVSEVLDRAGADDLKVLMVLCADPAMCRGCDDENWLTTIAEKAGSDADAVTAALAFWRGAGVITQGGKTRASKKVATASQAQVAPAEVSETPSTVQEVVTPKAKVIRNTDLPRYTTEELTKLLESRKELLGLINECQRIWGKMFNTHEVNIILGLVDYLGLEFDYVLSLLAYCQGVQERRGMPKSLRYVEKTAYGLYDEGVQDVSALNAKIQQMAYMAETEGKLRTLFGMGSRALTPKEKKCFSTWLYDFGYDMEIIRMAYDVTVDAKGAPNISYMNSVLANWHKEELRTPEAIRHAQELHKQSQGGQSKPAGQRSAPPSSGSFDTDDFFSAAVRRSLGDDFEDTDNE